MASAPPRVKLITIDGLFRQYDHRIALRSEERVTVLHGRNGVGKTITLSLVAALLQGDYEKLTTVPFKWLRIDFEDGSFLSMGAAKTASIEQPPGQKRKRRLDDEPPGDSGTTPIIQYDLRHHDMGASTAEEDTGSARPPRAISVERLLKWHRNSRFTVDALAQMGLTAPLHEAQELMELHKRTPVHFIEAQRLFRIVSTKGLLQDTTTVTSVVKDVANEMAEQIQKKDSTYRATATRLDDTLPARLFGPTKNGSKPSKKELARRTESLEAERRRLHEIGLLADTTSFNPSSLNDTQRAMFVVYLKDNEEKLGVFRDLADRAEILLGTLNRKFSPKSIKLDKDEGYKVLSHDGRPLDLDALSSGEQHELVLLHNLLFRVEPGSLLLIDEPELSLHVTWQDEFLADLIKIAKKVGFDAIVATHSPYIVGSRRELMERLGEPV
jgi:predicted ATPase